MKNLYGYTYVITGTLSIPRAQAEAMIVKAGGKVGKQADLKNMYVRLVVGEGGVGTAKHKAAVANKRIIITEAQMYKDMLGICGDGLSYFKKLAMAQVG